MVRVLPRCGLRRRLAAARARLGDWLCRHGLHALRDVPGAAVDWDFAHDARCKRCGVVEKVGYPGV